MVIVILISDSGLQDGRHDELISVNLQSDGSDSLGLTFKFNDSEQLIVEEIISDGIADKVHISVVLHITQVSIP